MLIHDIVVRPSCGTVGLVRQPDGKSELHVPPGMETMSARKALALLYKTFCVFRSTRRKRKRLAALDGVDAAASDGLAAATAESCTFHDALGLDELFDQLDEMRLLALLDGRGRVAADVHKRIDRYLHLAVFDDEGVPYLDRVPGNRRELRYDTGDLVGLYCFVAEDFYQRFLGVDVSVPWGRFASKGLALAADFRHRHLHADASLYDDRPDACTHTLRCLRHVLHAIHRRTPFRSPEYRLLHDALDRYLYGGTGAQSPKGLIWGVQDFWAVWESACLVHAMTTHGEHVLTCDFEHMPIALAQPQARERWLEQRYLLFARNEIERRPDLVIAADSEVTVVDFKFYTAAPRSRPKRKHDEAIDKQERDFLNIEVYGLLLQNHFLRADPQSATRLELQFWLPGAAHACVAWRHAPQWDPPLSIVTLPTADLLEAYSALYDLG
jgi:hypothetical protein